MYEIHKYNATSKTEQDSKAHWALTAALKMIKTLYIKKLKYTVNKCK